MNSHTLPSNQVALTFIALILVMQACSKGGDDNPGTPPPGPNPCASKNITVNATVTQHSDGCNPTGIVTVTASGSNGFTFSMDNGPFQAGAVFNNIISGSHTITAKDNAGCTKTANVNITAGASGPLFAAVKAIITTNCAVSGCHTGGAPTGNINFSVECNIVAQKANIKAKAVDAAGTALQMPPPPNAALSQADRDKITAWINAGGEFGD